MRRAFAQLLIPTAVAVVWYAAHVRSEASDAPSGTWREGQATVTGNPYAVSLSPGRTRVDRNHPAAAEDAGEDESPTGVADLSTRGDPRR